MIRTGLAVAAAIAALSATTGLAWGQGGVNVGHSGWHWANPQPQGNTLTDVEFAGGAGYAAGEFGTLLRTANGLDWAGVPTGLTADLHALRALDANTVVVGAGCAMRRSDDGGQTFRRVPLGAREQGCPSPLAAFHYPADQIGYVVRRDGSVSRSEVGSAFSGRRPVPGTPAGGGGPAVPTDMYFVSESTGFVTSGGAIYRTTDAAGTWTLEHTGTAPLHSVYFPSTDTGYAVGADDTVLKSTDGGDSWAPVPVASPESGGNLTRVRCASPVRCLISTESGDRVLRTRNGGTTVTAHDPSLRPIYAFAFSSSTNAVGVGERGATVFSGDAGTGTAMPGFTGVGDRLGGDDVPTLSRLRATDAQLVHATGNAGRLARSTDGGRSWSTVSVPSSHTITDVSFSDARSGFAVDSAGALRHTADGGATWTVIDTGDVPGVRAIHALDPNVVLVFTRSGVYRSTRASDASGAGTTFAPVGSGRVRRTSFREFDRTDAPVLFARSSTALWRSSDRGATWRAVPGPVRRARYRAIDFTSERQGFVLLTNGRMFSTSDGGRAWTELRGVGSSAARDIAFGDARNGYLTLPSWGAGPRGGWVLRTADGGASWRPQLIGEAPIASRGLEAPSAPSAFALGRGPGRGADLFRTQTGGDGGARSFISVTPSKRRLGRRGGRVRLTVSLNPALSGARVALFARTGAGRWRKVADGPTTAGRLSVVRRVRRTTRFVAQWHGDADRQGDGSGARTVAVRR